MLTGYYIGDEFPELKGKAIEVKDDLSNPKNPCYKIRFKDTRGWIGNIDDEDISFEKPQHYMEAAKQKITERKFVKKTNQGFELRPNPVTEKNEGEQDLKYTVRDIEKLLSLFYTDVLKGKVVNGSITKHVVKEWLKENSEIEILNK